MTRDLIIENIAARRSLGMEVVRFVADDLDLKIEERDAAFAVALAKNHDEIVRLRNRVTELQRANNVAVEQRRAAEQRASIAAAALDTLRAQLTELIALTGGDRAL